MVLTLWVRGRCEHRSSRAVQPLPPWSQRAVRVIAPVDGFAGRAWRAGTLPFRLAAPVVLLALRVVTGRRWTESVRELPGSGPKVVISDADDVQPPKDGAGPLNHRSYSVTIANPSLNAWALVDAFRQDPNQFAPTSYATFVPDPSPEGLTEGDESTVKLPGPWDGPVRVATVEPGRLRLETLVDHMEAGWIEFTATTPGDESVVFTIESFARSGDPVFDVLYHQVGIGKLLQTQMWVRTLESLVEASGGRQVGRITVTTTIYLGAEDQ